ncbi:MAG: hypothetical protein K2M15_02565, partial [Oscillospiraceae bacterium]|nr:hypothetical protein [Oscillospiraceae bacterium]
MKRRILSMIAALALCLSLCPAVAFAAEVVPDVASVPAPVDELAGDELPEDELDEANVPAPIDEPAEGAVAMVETSDGTTVYLSESDFANAFDNTKYNNVTVTLLSDIQPGSIDMGDVQARVHIFNTSTLDLAGHTITGSDTTIYIWPTSNLTIQDSSSGKTGQVVSTGGAAILTQTGMVSLTGGTYTGNPTIDGKNSSTNVSSLLANCGAQDTPHYAYFDAQGNPIALEESQRELTGTVTVKECTHSGGLQDNGDGTHSINCPYCGYTGAAENCSYGDAQQHDETSHTRTCTVCGYEKVETHTFGSASKEESGFITFFYQCLKCNYTTEPIGTAQLTIPQNLVYGQTAGKIISVEPNFSYESITLDLDWSGNEVNSASIELPAVMSVGMHMVCILIVAEGFTNESYVAFTVGKAPLTEDMVALPASVAYSGAAQKPTITVKQGENPLTEGTDYDLAYSTTDFTNVGTVTVTVTGKGNYEGTVKKTFTIEKATPTTTALRATLFYGQKLSDSDLNGGSAVNPNSGAAVEGKWSWASPNTQPAGSGPFAMAFTPADTKNYEIPASSEVSVTVNPAEPKLTLSVPAYQVANGDVTVTHTVANPYDAGLQDVPAVTLTYKIGDTTETIGADGKFHIPEGTAVGTVITVTMTAAAVDGKYTAATKTATVEVTDKIPVEITGVSVTGRAYNGTAIKYTGAPVVKTLDGKTVTGAAVTYTWSTADGGAPVNAGDYSLEITAGGEYAGKTTLNFTISKASVTITAASKSATVGSAQPELTYTVTGLVGDDKLLTEPTLACAPDMNTVGSYPITASGAAVPNTGNYNSEITYVAGALTVTAVPSSGGSSGGGGSSSGTSLPVSYTQL